MLTFKPTITSPVFLVCLWIIPANPVDAQLSTRLRTESLSDLARDARQGGDAVRGAILFPQEALGCAKCHVDRDQNRIGPDLTQIANDRSDEYLVESLLNPSKSISRGFETTTVLTIDGQVYRGRLLSSTNEQIVLRQDSSEHARLTLGRDELERIAEDNQSLMPANLVDQLKDRQQFLDLVRYLIQLRDSAETPDLAPELPRQALDPALSGLVLIDQYQCGRCHTDDLTGRSDAPRSAPRLSQLSHQLAPTYIQQFISDPLHAKPGSGMPNLLTNVSQPERDRIALEITHHLISEAEDRYVPPVIDAAAAERGGRLFHTIGCVACHSPLDADGQPLLDETSVPLGPLQYSMKGLTEFLEDPLATRPSGRMPNMKLSHFEAVDLANYLLSTRTPNDASHLQPDPRLAEAGRHRFQQYQCNVCHDGDAVEPSPDTGPRFAALSVVRLDQGCLSAGSGAWPNYELTQSEVAAIRATLTRLGSGDRLQPEQQIRVSMAILRCTSCHSRGDFGGVADLRRDYFQTTNLNLGPQGSIPPSLTEVGAKLRPKWMRQVLVSGRSIRPYVQTRMPQYGAPNIEHLIDLFQTVDRLPTVDFPVIGGREQQKAIRDRGFELVSNDGLNCVACHTFQFKPGMTMSAVDLTEMHERLKPDWFYHFMRDPKRFNRGTVMPTFWSPGQAVRKEILDGDSHQQIAAIWEWMKEGRQARTPRGLILEPMELLALDETVMLRRSYPGIGKRGIGVGYRQQVNLAFDAEQMRVALLWKGKFANPAGVWRGQGHGTVRPLARQQIKFLPGPEIDDLEDPWLVDEGRPPKHRFQGYVLDDQRRPTFLYKFEEVSIRDYSIGLPESPTAGPTIRRTITLESEYARTGLVLRITPEQQLTKLAPGAYKIGDSLSLRFETNGPGPTLTGAGPTLTGAGPTLTGAGPTLTGDGQQSIQVPIDLAASQPTTLTVEYQWRLPTQTQSGSTP